MRRSLDPDAPPEAHDGLLREGEEAARAFSAEEPGGQAAEGGEAQTDAVTDASEDDGWATESESEGWVTESESDVSAKDSEGPPDMRAWAEQIVAESFQEFRAGKAADTAVAGASADVIADYRQALDGSAVSDEADSEHEPSEAENPARWIGHGPSAAHDQLQQALSPSRAAPASLERPGTPPDKLGRASRLIRFASPVVAKSKVRTPSPAKEDGAMPAEASPEDGGAVGDDAQPGVGVSADDAAALSSDSDSDGWVTDEGSSEGSEPGQTGDDDADLSDSMSRYAQAKSRWSRRRQAAAGREDGSAQSVLAGFVSARERRTGSSTAPQQRRGRGALPRGKLTRVRGTRTAVSAAEAPESEAAVPALADGTPEQVPTEPARHGAPQARARIASAAPARHGDATDAHGSLTAAVEEARQQRLARASSWLSPVTPVAGSVVSPASDAATPPEEPCADVQAKPAPRQIDGDMAAGRTDHSKQAKPWRLDRGARRALAGRVESAME